MQPHHDTFKNQEKNSTINILQAVNHMEDDKLTTTIIFSGVPIDAGFVKSLLENAGIHAFLKDENMGTIAPWYAAPGGAGAVKIIINSQDYDQAKSIVDEFERSRTDT